MFLFFYLLLRNNKSRPALPIPGFIKLHVMKSDRPGRVRKTLLFSCCFFTALYANAQLTFQLTAGGSVDGHYSRVAIQTQDGGYLIGGQTQLLDPGRNDMCLIKLDANGDTMWTKIYGDMLTWEEPNKIIEQADGSLVICGTYYTNASTAQEIFLMHTDAAGALLWCKGYGGNSDDYAPDFIQTSDGGFILTGQTNSYGLDFIDMYVIKTNSTGDTLWTSTFGGGYIEYGSLIAEVPGGGYQVAGQIKTGFASTTDVLLVRLDAQGQLLWSSSFGNSSNTAPAGLVVLPDGSCVIGGSGANPANNSSDYFLTKRDAQGQDVWSYYYGGPGIHDCFSMERCADGGYAMCGVTDNNTNANWDGMLMKTDSTGQLLWEHKYGGGMYDYFDGLSQTSDNGFILSGGKTGSNGLRALYVVKTDASGNSLCNTYALPLTQYSFLMQSVPTSHVREYGGSPANITFPMRGYMPVTTLCTNVGSNENELPQTALQLFPNPAAPGETIQLGGNWMPGNTVQVQVFDVAGRLLLTQTYSGQNSSVTLPASYAPGVYTIRVSPQRQLPGNIKWVIQ